MTVRKGTVWLPEELVRELTRRVPTQQRSRYIARALARSIRDELDAMNDPVKEWEGAAAR